MGSRARDYQLRSLRDEYGYYGDVGEIGMALQFLPRLKLTTARKGN